MLYMCVCVRVCVRVCDIQYNIINSQLVLHPRMTQGNILLQCRPSKENEQITPLSINCKTAITILYLNVEEEWLERVWKKQSKLYRPKQYCCYHNNVHNNCVLTHYSKWGSERKVPTEKCLRTKDSWNNIEGLIPLALMTEHSQHTHSGPLATPTTQSTWKQEREGS